MSERRPIYLHDWSESGEAGMLSDFQASPDVLSGATVIVASYTYENYSGDAYVLFERDGKLFEVHGGHCSCYGLEGQWEPEEADRDAIIHRITKGTWHADAVAVKGAVLAALQAAA
ncbi:hypothetical protein [Rhizobium aethiopicum]|uniref:Uncharacterized protein n=1 Tax=Rhizobium aethiopicum TaxID=1138170 RepID=A0A7W6QA40_9HYPH|nr:hypothetical protein [Rhizobium aethiopicum]MBB4192767.1 hypothetical protein [Rhizobium aethiopicum]